MSNNDQQPTNLEPSVEQADVACASTCGRRRSGLLRAALYTPVVLILGTLAALATFPELAHYAGPLVGDSASSSSGNTGCPIAACASQVASALGYSSSGTGCCSAKRAAFSCCVDADVCPSSTESNQSAENPGLTADEGPADATAAANAIETLEADSTPSN